MKLRDIRARFLREPPPELPTKPAFPPPPPEAKLPPWHRNALFVCVNGHGYLRLIAPDVKWLPCPECGDLVEPLKVKLKFRPPAVPPAGKAADAPDWAAWPSDCDVVGCNKEPSTKLAEGAYVCSGCWGDLTSKPVVR